MTYETAARILADHDMQFRPSVEDGCIDALAVSVTRDGTIIEEWEAVPMNRAALRDWLGY